MKKLFVSLLGIALLSAGTFQVLAADSTDKATIAGEAIAQLLIKKDQTYVQKFYNFLDGLMAKFTASQDTAKTETLTTIKDVLIAKIPYTPGENYTTVCTDKTKTPVACTLDYTPVCGADASTYGNICALSAAGVERLHDGVCTSADKPTVCTLEYAPVCGTDGKTYANMCNLRVSDAAFLMDGTCESNVEKLSCTHTPATTCTKEFAPVCGTNSITYNNSCLAQAANVKYTEGACPVGTCTKEFLPVCGKNGNTYANACLANAAGTDMDYEGTCK